MVTAAIVLAGAAAFFSAAAAANENSNIDPIVVKGSKFFYQHSGDQFFIKGVAYQENYSGGGGAAPGNANDVAYTDPLSMADACKRDVTYLQQLGTNTIRVYQVNPAANHDECMSLLQEAGIYVIADLAAPIPGGAIDQDSPSWTVGIYDRYTSVVDALARYDNVIGFFAGNEVANNGTQSPDMAFVKAATRDIKAYIKSQNYRTMYVGYAATDDAYRAWFNEAHYLNCGSDASDNIDFFGINVYSWCGNSSYTTSGYNVLTQDFSNYSLPVFFAEYGCITAGVRSWQDSEALFSPPMVDVWSGGIAYQYFQTQNNYGLVQVTNDSVSMLPDFTNLKSVMQSSIHPSSTAMNAYSPTNTELSSCPTFYANWSAAASPLPPTPDRNLCDCMMSSLSCILSPDADPTKYGTLFGQVCGLDAKACEGIVHNATSGYYGAYSACNASAQLSWAFNSYFNDQNQERSACNFSGAASIEPASSSSSQCSSLLSSAGNGAPTASAGAVGGPDGTPASRSAASKSKYSGDSAFVLSHVTVLGALVAVVTIIAL